jgi:pentatricopeptide repeat protein
MEAAGISAATAEHNLIVRAAVAAGRVSQALAWVRNMRRSGVPVDVVTFANVLPAATTRAQIARAVDVLRELYERNYLPTTKVALVVFEEMREI